MKHLKYILILLFFSCTHQVYVTESVIPTDRGLIHLGDAKKFVPNGRDTVTILFQASGTGKTKSW